MKTAKAPYSWEIREALNKAADWLEKNRWCQGVAANPSLEHAKAACLLGSVMIASGGLLCDAVLFHDCRIRLKSEGFTTNWNDEPLRTKEEVIKALRSTAEKCIGETYEQVGHSG